MKTAIAEVPVKDWFLGWGGAPRLGLDPKVEKKEYGNDWDMLAKPSSELARWQRKLAREYTFTVHVRLAMEFLQHFRQIPEWEDAQYISLGDGCYRRAPTQRIFGG